MPRFPLERFTVEVFLLCAILRLLLVATSPVGKRALQGGVEVG